MILYNAKPSESYVYKKKKKQNLSQISKKPMNAG